ncbi:MAG: quinate 5-dehydrogenase [Armatimonadetes bacterium]|nr:quinate 5-dehydrogenase [Armatimonadota bacterium]
MKRIVSVSLGSSQRDKSSTATLLGEQFCLERIGVDGDLDKFAAKFKKLDGEVDAFGIGGADLYLWVGDRRYTFRQIKFLVSGAVKSPVVDGSGLKNTLEPRLIERLDDQGVVDFKNSRCLLTGAVDRFGMAQALAKVCPRVVYGDLMFSLGLPIRLTSYRAVESVGRIVLPIVTRLPFKWFYPTGEKQDKRTPKFAWAFDEADVICGDWHFIKRYCPDRMGGKTIITNTLRKSDLEFLRGAGIKQAIASTPTVDGESFGTNVMEAALVAILGKRPEELTKTDYESALDRLGWEPSTFEL